MSATIEHIIDTYGDYFVVILCTIGQPIRCKYAASLCEAEYLVNRYIK